MIDPSDTKIATTRSNKGPLGGVVQLILGKAERGKRSKYTRQGDHASASRAEEQESTSTRGEASKDEGEPAKAREREEGRRGGETAARHTPNQRSKG